MVQSPFFQVGGGDGEAVIYGRGIGCHRYDHDVFSLLVVRVIGNDNHGPSFLGRQVGKRDGDEQNIPLFRHCSTPRCPRGYSKIRDCFPPRQSSPGKCRQIPRQTRSHARQWEMGQLIQPAHLFLLPLRINSCLRQRG